MYVSMETTVGMKWGQASWNIPHCRATHRLDRDARSNFHHPISNGHVQNVAAVVALTVYNIEIRGEGKTQEKNVET